jgi:hypothetical protein
MNSTKKLEAMAEGWLKNAPHLPLNGQKWLAQNVWWIALIGAISTGLGLIFGIFALIALLAPPVYVYYVPLVIVSGWAIASAVIALVFYIIHGLLLAFSVKPLKDMQKKGWVLLFIALLAQVLNVVIMALLNLFSVNIAGFFFSLIFSAIGIVIGAYFLFEIRSQFAHTTKTAKK